MSVRVENYKNVLQLFLFQKINVVNLKMEVVSSESLFE